VPTTNPMRGVKWRRETIERKKWIKNEATRKGGAAWCVYPLERRGKSAWTLMYGKSCEVFFFFFVEKKLST